jgi:hypothetical protein
MLLAAPVARLFTQNVTHAPQVSRFGTVHPAPRTVEVPGLLFPSFLLEARRREVCHGPRTCQSGSNSGRERSSWVGVLNKTYLTLVSSWSSLSGRISMSQRKGGVWKPKRVIPSFGVSSNPRYLLSLTDRIVHWPSLFLSRIHWRVYDGGPSTVGVGEIAYPLVVPAVGFPSEHGCTVPASQIEYQPTFLVYDLIAFA